MKFVAKYMAESGLVKAYSPMYTLLAIGCG